MMEYCHVPPQQAVSALAVLVLACLAIAGEAAEPVTLTTGERMVVLRLPDGTLMGNRAPTGGQPQEATARYSGDNGTTWGEPQTLFALAEDGGRWAGLEALLDSRAEVHLFFLRYAEAGGPLPKGAESVAQGYLGGYSGKRLDIWHARSSEQRQSWSEPRPIWLGYTGALNSVIQMTSGRIVCPFGAQQPPRSFGGGGEDLEAFTHMGPFGATAVYSDDFGETWHPSPDTLRVPVPSFVHGYGADEPVVVELKDGRVWMLMRTQLGRLWQSFSGDGARWSPPEPTEIISSDSPAGIVRLDDGRLVLFWNNCQRYPYAFGGRHVLHAAISDDEGRTWRGYREVARDPRRQAPPPARGDFGTAYPFPAVVDDAKVIYCTGQGEGRILLMRLDPEWLLQTHHDSQFAAGVEEEWHTFGTRGVEYLTHEQDAQARVLSIRKTDRDWPAAAVWNFPSGLAGGLSLSIMLRPGCAGVRVSLTDHFSVPFDPQAFVHSVFNVEVGPDGTLLGHAKVTPGEWHELELDWSTQDGRCSVALDARPVGDAPLLRQTTGVCYLRLRATAPETDPSGFAVASVEVDVANE
jgi:hypothetical protein